MDEIEFDKNFLKRIILENFTSMALPLQKIDVDAEGCIFYRMCNVSLENYKFKGQTYNVSIDIFFKIKSTSEGSVIKDDDSLKAVIFSKTLSIL